MAERVLSVPLAVATLAQQPEIVYRVSAQRLFDDMVNVGVPP
jgi:hypothetical protein